MEDGLRRELAVDYDAPRVRGSDLPGRRRVLRPGLDLTSNRAIQEFLDEGVELDKLR